MKYATNARIRRQFWADGDWDKSDYKFLIADSIDELYEAMAKLKAENDAGYELSLLDPDWNPRLTPSEGILTTFSPIYEINGEVEFDQNAFDSTDAWKVCLADREEKRAKKDNILKQRREAWEARERAQYEALQAKFGDKQ